MNQEKLFRLSCRAARGLIEGLESGDLERIQRNLAAIHHYVDLAETVPAKSLHGAALYRREQLELLGGVTEDLAGALGKIQKSLAARMEALGAHRRLLQHIVGAPAIQYDPETDPELALAPAK